MLFARITGNSCSGAGKLSITIQGKRLTVEGYMGTATKATFEEFANLPDPEGRRYELDEGDLLMAPSPSVQHNRIRDRIARRLTEYVELHQSGEIMVEMDFRLGPDTVRKPDVAFVTASHMAQIDVEHSPVSGAPALAVEVISPANSAQDTVKKTRQYLRTGCTSVWIIYPTLRLIEIHSATGLRKVEEPEELRDEVLFPGLSMSLSYLFDGTRG
jgi:Uma2 family endonuclease